MKYDTITFTTIGIILNTLACLWLTSTGQAVYALMFLFNAGVMFMYLLDKRDNNAGK